MKELISSTRRQSSWDQRFKELKAFKKTHGHCNVPSKYPPNPTLGKWVVNIRYAKKHGKLAEERVRRLDAIGICWEHKSVVDAATWEQHIQDLEAFKKEHGHCNVPRRYLPYPFLGEWGANVRRRKKQGKLAEERVRRLDALDFRWDRQTTWEQRIIDLKAFKKEHGHCNVPRRNPQVHSGSVGERRSPSEEAWHACRGQNPHSRWSRLLLG